ncbi:MAG: MerR family transcriptional regulator [Acidothermus cellulolyticus]|nr:MerR family transcriptional regulator [Acidothermus cellulolyticus]
MSNRSVSRAFFSIGEVLAQLRPDFPDVTISKIRFLESEGLIEPERTPAGYRKFTPADVARLRYVLTAQRDHYLPLRVIKEHLHALDQGLQPPLPGGTGLPRAPVSVVGGEGMPGSDAFAPDGGEVRLSRAEFLQAAGIADEELATLENFGLIAPRGSTYDGTALAIAKTVKELTRFGIEPRHLRAFRAAADREVGLVEQVITPLVRQRSPEARARAEEVAREIAALSVRLHAALVRSGLRPLLSR